MCTLGHMSIGTCEGLGTRVCTGTCENSCSHNIHSYACAHIYLYMQVHMPTCIHRHTTCTHIPLQDSTSPPIEDTVVSSSTSSVLESSLAVFLAKGGGVTGRVSGRLGSRDEPCRGREGKGVSVLHDQSGREEETPESSYRLLRAREHISPRAPGPTTGPSCMSGAAVARAVQAAEGLVPGGHRGVGQRAGWEPRDPHPAASGSPPRGTASQAVGLAPQPRSCQGLAWHRGSGVGLWAAGAPLGHGHVPTKLWFPAEVRELVGPAVGLHLKGPDRVT